MAALILDLAAAADLRLPRRRPRERPRPGVMDRSLVAWLRERGVTTIGGLREGLCAIDRLARETD